MKSLPNEIEQLRIWAHETAEHARGARRAFMAGVERLRKSRSQRRVLIVDTDTASAAGIARMLAGVADIVIEFTGEKALERLRRETYDALICDDVHVSNGVPFLRSVRRIDPLIPVIIVSENADKAEDKYFGVAARFSKPFALETVQRTVEAILS